MLEKKRDMSADLLIVDVQPAFSKYFNDKYLEELNKYCYQFGRVFHIWDSTKNTDIYRWPLESITLEKRYGGQLLDSELDNFFSPDVAVNAKTTWTDKKPGWYNETVNGDAWMFIGHRHQWFYIPKDMLTWVKRLAKGDRELTLVGGADDECLYDIEIMLAAFGVKFTKEMLYVYSAKGCRFVPNEEKDKKKADKEKTKMEIIGESVTPVKYK